MKIFIWVLINWYHHSGEISDGTIEKLEHPQLANVQVPGHNLFTVRTYYVLVRGEPKINIDVKCLR